MRASSITIYVEAVGEGLHLASADATDVCLLSVDARRCLLMEEATLTCSLIQMLLPVELGRAFVVRVVESLGASVALRFHVAVTIII